MGSPKARRPRAGPPRRRRQVGGVGRRAACPCRRRRRRPSPAAGSRPRGRPATSASSASASSSAPGTSGTPAAAARLLGLDLQGHRLDLLGGAARPRSARRRRRRGRTRGSPTGSRSRGGWRRRPVRCAAAPGPCRRADRSRRWSGRAGAPPGPRSARGGIRVGVGEHRDACVDAHARGPCGRCGPRSRRGWRSAACCMIFLTSARRRSRSRCRHRPGVGRGQRHGSARRGSAAGR